MPTGAERDREATESRLIAAVEDLILRDGFAALGVNSVAKQAGADKVLIYRYFGGLKGLLAAYAERGDFWWEVDPMLAEPLPNPSEPNGLARCLSVVFTRHVQFLREHPVTLEVIAWETAARNELTEALEAVREARSREMMRRVAKRFALKEGSFLRQAGPMLALLGAAANYLAARGRRLGTFNGIDLQSDKGWRTLEQSAAAMIGGVFAADAKDLAS